MPETFRDRKDRLLNQLKQTRALTPELEQAVIDVYGGRGKRALDAVKRGCVIKRGRRWFVRGKSDEYEVVRDFCTCRDYVLNIATEKAGVDMCYHALAKNICETLDSNYSLEQKD